MRQLRAVSAIFAALVSTACPASDDAASTQAESSQTSEASETNAAATGDWLDCSEQSDATSCDAVGTCLWLPAQTATINPVSSECTLAASEAGACLPLESSDSCIDEAGPGCSEKMIYSWARATGTDGVYELVYVEYPGLAICAGLGVDWEFCGPAEAGSELEPACACLCDSL